MLNYFYNFPAIRGLQAKREYYSIMCPLEILSKLFIFHDDELTPEFRAQRKVNESRIPEIANYIIENPKDYVFSSITASVDGVYKFEKIGDNVEDVGILSISMDSKLLINDGQHRKLAIDEALKQKPALKNESISVVLFIDENLQRSQQMFSDLNKHAVNVSKSIGILYDSRDPIALLVKDIVFNINNFKKYTDLENNSLSKNSNRLFLLSNIYNATARMLKNLNINKHEKIVREFWGKYLNEIKEFQFVYKKEMSPKLLRQDYLLTYGTVIEAIGIIINEQIKKEEISIKDLIDKLNRIDWSRGNNIWKNRALNNNGRIIKNNFSILLTAIQLKRFLDIEITCEEMDIEKLNLEGQDD